VATIGNHVALNPQVCIRKPRRTQSVLA